MWYNPTYMEHAPVTPPTASKTSPRDFFLWAGALIALYGSVASFLTLTFEYINRAFPDALTSYGDPYGGAVRFSMATLIVLVPVALILFRIIRSTIQTEPGKAQIWVRRWALVLTLFIAGAAIAIDLITLINYFLMGETTVRFVLKVAIVLLVAAAVFMHFLADLKGYWIANAKKANLIGIAVGLLALGTIIAGFCIVGTPADARMYRFDQEKVSDLQSIQYQVINHWQSKGTLPATLEDSVDPLNSYSPSLIDKQTKQPYGYEVTGDMSFKLCATFNKESQDLEGMGGFGGDYVMRPSPMGMNDSWNHGAGETCFERTIDPDFYPPFDRPAAL